MTKEENKWISVEERLPEIPPAFFEDGNKIIPCNTRVLVFDGEDVYEKSFGIIEWPKEITHWQPLPSPPSKTK